jgi:hypothetical protein
MVDFKDSEQREAFQQLLDNAIDRWMEKQFAQFGKWTIRGIGAMLLGAAVWVYFHSGGFKP